ncbi:IPExxxVDY family protein [Flavobacteriaceae bacterium]|jgi:hypothetical protein|nr:IPExxxVDY family protein [Flavobacteriales bacterium]MBL6877964.1 IPExxxVDY family protein [Flavobacteriaceae bacterium]MDA9850197.1 IPExxxVDY family protein [Flavobacteriaceae bacterium]
MAVRKIIFQEEEPLHYHLLAIHSVLTDYRLAFFLNKHLNIELKRAFEDLDISRQDGFYSFFQYEDEDNLLNWNLISNSSYTNVKNEIKESLLFKNTQVELKKFKLMNELSQVDFFLKIEYHTDHININQIIKSINEIPNIISVYSLNLNNIKNKENLNFS